MKATTFAAYNNNPEGDLNSNNNISIMFRLELWKNNPTGKRPEYNEYGYTPLLNQSEIDEDYNF